ncbi:MAG TPA: deoxyribodipyrimidine photo-lyase [Bryobacteraceae bacterium]|nr:deoxyribodipyrimidine photo-lyase [Bryobacteraceae bacterium]
MTGVGAAPTLLWFRQDLRLSDNPALSAALERRSPVIPVFIWAPEEEGDWPPGAASRWWLHHSLASLRAALERRGSRLIIRRGPTAAALSGLVTESDASAVLWNRRYEPAAVARDRELKSKLRDSGLIAESFNGSLLFEPWTIRNSSEQPFRVFTPFWRACLTKPLTAISEDAPEHMLSPDQWPHSLDLAGLSLEPAVDWAGGFRQVWQPGESGARSQLRRFLREALAEYPVNRDRPSLVGTSRLSPHLHFGEISPGAVQRAILGLANGNHGACEAYLRQLGWREFAYHLLYHHPQSPHQALRQEFAAFPWRMHPEHFKAWKRGETGYPLVDAGMRELWHTGWMHNRVRMVAASLLVKHLLIDWQAGAAWFWDTLVDADLANNTLGWQWVAGCGADAAPYFRIFNPAIQAGKFDPDGDYVRRWVSESKHSLPIVDHGEARERALAALESIRKR